MGETPRIAVVSALAAFAGMVAGLAVAQLLTNEVPTIEATSAARPLVDSEGAALDRNGLDRLDSAIERLAEVLTGFDREQSHARRAVGTVDGTAADPAQMAELLERVDRLLEAAERRNRSGGHAALPLLDRDREVRPSDRDAILELGGWNAPPDSDNHVVHSELLRLHLYWSLSDLVSAYGFPDTVYSGQGNRIQLLYAGLSGQGQSDVQVVFTLLDDRVIDVHG